MFTKFWHGLAGTEPKLRDAFWDITFLLIFKLPLGYVYVHFIVIRDYFIPLLEVRHLA